MKALVLAGGLGLRLRPFSHTMAKQLVPVANKPTLFYGLEAIRDAGITEVGIIVGERADDIRHAVGDGARLGLRVTFLPQDRPAGLAHCVLIARDFLGDDDFVMYLGDNVIPEGIAEPVDGFRAARPAAMLYLKKVADPSESGVAELDPDGRVVRLVEKPATFVSDLAVMGAYVFSPAIHEAVRAIGPSGRGELEITHALQWLVDRGGPVLGRICHGYWQDTGRLDSLLECNRHLLDRLRPDVRGRVDAASELTGSVVVEPGAVVTGSRLIGPVIVGAGARVTGSVVGAHTAIGAGCVLTGSCVSDSVLLPEATLDGVRDVSGSVLGRRSTVRLAPDGPPHQLVLGDDAQVVLGR